MEARNNAGGTGLPTVPGIEVPDSVPSSTALEGLGSLLVGSTADSIDMPEGKLKPPVV
jgi:hypothetical protein